MKIKATLEVEYEVDPNQYTFSKPGDKKEAILKLERISLADDFNCLIAPGQVTVVEIEEVEIEEVKDINGTTRWYKNGKLHREDGPAVEYSDGMKEWYENGKLHCENGPAIEYASGTKEWFRNGQRHREDGPAVVCANGTRYWYRNGQWEDGPAIEDTDAFIAYVERVKNGTQEHFQEIYLGVWGSEEDFAKHVFKIRYPQTPNIEKLPLSYFFNHLFFCEYFSIKSKTGVHVFRNI